MKRIILALAILLFSTTAQATEVGNSRGFGLGFQLGSPSGFTGKAFLDRGSAIDFGIGWHGYGWYRRGRCWDDRRDVWYACDPGWRYRNWSIHLDYLWEDVLAQGSARLDWHIGVGGRLIVWDDDYYYDRYGEHDDFGLIARMPLGLDLTFRRPDFLEVFFEIAPGLFVVPFVDFNMDAVIGVRFYF